MFKHGPAGQTSHECDLLKNSLHISHGVCFPGSPPRNTCEGKQGYEDHSTTVRNTERTAGKADFIKRSPKVLQHTHKPPQRPPRGPPRLARGRCPLVFQVKPAFQHQ